MSSKRNIQTITIVHNNRTYTGKFDNELSENDNKNDMRSAIDALETIERLFVMIQGE
jgi:hypothetical protein